MKALFQYFLISITLGLGVKNLSASESFQLLDAIAMENKPSLEEHGFKRLVLVPARELWPKDASIENPNPKYANDFIKTKYPSDDIICLDIEHWPLHRTDRASIDRNINKLLNVFYAVKSARPNDKVGYYGILPIREYHAAAKNNVNELSDWRVANKHLQNIASEMDIIFPSLYTFYSNKEGWHRYAVANLQEAAKYGKPVYAFLWPQYHPSNRFRGYDFVPADYWKMQLETVYEHADGVVIWTPYTKRTEWNENADWWLATLSFLEEHVQK